VATVYLSLQPFDAGGDGLDANVLVLGFEQELENGAFDLGDGEGGVEQRCGRRLHGRFLLGISEPRQARMPLLRRNCTSSTTSGSEAGWGWSEDRRFSISVTFQG
jgi:hypothetical protein